MKSRTLALAVLMCLVIGALVFVRQGLRKTDKHAAASCLRSVLHGLTNHPELIPQTGGSSESTWNTLDTSASSDILKDLAKMNLLDCYRFEQITNNRDYLGTFLRIQVKSGGGGTTRVRVIGAGADGRFDTEDDEIIEQK